MSNLVANERTKLWSTFWNNVGVAAVVTGAIVPSMSGDVSFPKFVAGIVSGLIIGNCCAAFAIWQLRFLKDN